MAGSSLVRSQPTLPSDAVRSVEFLASSIGQFHPARGEDAAELAVANEESLINAIQFVGSRLRLSLHRIR